MSARRRVHSSRIIVHNCFFVTLISIIAAYFLFTPQPALADCSGDSFYWDSGRCIHKTGGVSDPDHPEADDQGCVYDFIPMSTEISEQQCTTLNTTDPGPNSPNPSPAPNPSTSPGASPAPSVQLSPSPSPSTGPRLRIGLTSPSTANWSAAAQSTFTTDNLLCSALEILASCPYPDPQPYRVALGDGKYTVAMFDQKPGGGAALALAGIIGTMYTPPTSSVQYLAGVFKNFGFAEPAYAQTFDVPGSGASVIAPVLKLWQIVRNISYLAFILIFLGVGFMIMFRQKINPQTVVTAQAALPGLVIGLLLVTFSYFIAALIIDLAFVGIPLATNIVIQAAPNNAFGNKDALENMARDSNILQMFSTTAGNMLDIGRIYGGVAGTISSSPATQVAGGLIMAVIGGIIGTLVFPGVGTVIGAVAGGATGPFFSLPGLVSLILPLILIIALVIQMLKLLMALIATYLQLLVATLTGPFVILAASLPGKGGGIGDWLKNLLANALVFPAVFAAFLFAGVILGTTPDEWRATPPLFGGLSLNIIGTLLGFGVVMAMPAIPDAVRNAFGIKPQQGGIVGAALGGFTAGFGALQGATAKGYGAATGTLKREKEAYQKEKAAAAVSGNGPAGPLPSWKERLFKKGLPF